MAAPPFPGGNFVCVCRKGCKVFLNPFLCTKVSFPEHTTDTVAEQRMVINSQTPLQVPKGKYLRNMEKWLGIRLQKLLESLWLAPTEPETQNEWIPQWFIVIRHISETGAATASSALIEHNAKQCSEMPNGTFNNLIKEPRIQIPFFFFLIKKKKALA